MTTEFDDFSVQLLEESKRFLEKASEVDENAAYLHAALVLGFSALESHVNGIAEELLERTDTPLLDQSLLTERAVKFNNGEWVLGRVQYFRLEDRIGYLFKRFSQQETSSYPWWPELAKGIKARNSLVHPKDAVVLTPADVQRYLDAIVGALNSLYLAVFKRGHPSYGRGLDSTLTF